MQDRGIPLHVAAKELIDLDCKKFPAVTDVGRQRKALTRAIRLLLRLPSRTNYSALERCIRTVSPAMIHCHFGTSAYDVAKIHSRLHQTPRIIVSFHGFDVFRVGNIPRGYISAIKQLVEKGALCTVPSRFLKSATIASFDLDEKSVEVVQNGYNRIFYRRNPVRFDGGDLNIACVGRLIQLKGQRFLIGAVSVLQKRGVTARLHLVGSGPTNKSLERLAHNALDPGTYQFHGSLSHLDTATLLRRMNMYVQPSVSMPGGQSESYGVALLEAVASGLPVIATSSGGMAEIVEPIIEPFAQVVEEKSEIAIADAIENYLISSQSANYPEYLKQRQRVLTENSLESAISKYLTLYKRLLGDEYRRHFPEPIDKAS